MKTPEERAQEVRREMMDAATGDRTNTEWNQMMCYLIAREIREAVAETHQENLQEIRRLQQQLLSLQSCEP